MSSWPPPVEAAAPGALYFPVLHHLLAGLPNLFCSCMKPKTPSILRLISLACLLALGLVGAGVWLWLNARPQPEPASQELFQGVSYQREVRQSPRPLVIHVVTVDLRAPGISFLVTPGDPQQELPLKARTTSQFLHAFNVQLAVNGDGFQPWRSRSILDYYPHSGDRIAPNGLAVSQGTVYSEAASDAPVLYISRTNQARFNTPIGRLYNAISGNLMLVEQGKAAAIPESEPEPRSAVALDKAGRRLIIVVVDGRQPGYSQGATLAELAELLLTYGGNIGMNLDGGGSTTLVKQSPGGSPVVLNSPIDQRIPGWQRPVGNHLGIYAQLLTGE